MIKFQRYAVVNTETKARARVHYSLDNRIDERRCVTLYANDTDGRLGKVLASDYVNRSDCREDYFEAGKAVLFEDHPLYAEARAFAETLRT